MQQRIPAVASHPSADDADETRRAKDIFEHNNAEDIASAGEESVATKTGS